MPFCTKCGYEIADNVRFCTKCGAAQQGEQNPTPNNENSSQSNDDKPALWGPTAAVNLSVFLFPLGAFIHYKNWKVLKEERKARESLIWFLCMLASIVIVFCLPLYAWSLLIPIVIIMLIAWYITSAKSQIKYVKEKYGMEYKKESLLIPILMVVFVYISIMAVVILKISLPFGGGMINTVKNGSMSACPKYTVDQMVNGFIANPEYKHIVSNNIDYVNISGLITYNNKPANAVLQLWVRDDKFGFQAFEINGTPQGKYMAAALINKMCEAAVDDFGK